MDAGLKGCSRCGTPSAELLKAEYVVWVDQNNCFHTSDECEFFQGQYRLLTLEDAVAQGMTACMDCGASQYVSLTAAPSPTPVAQEEQSPEVVPVEGDLTEAQRMEIAKGVTVYYSNGSRYYHTSGQCQTMKHGSEHSMYEAITTGHEWCPVCQPKKLEELTAADAQ